MKETLQKLFNSGSKARIIVIVIAVLAVGYWLGATFSSSRPAVESATDKQPVVKEKAQVWTCSMHPHIRRSKPGLCPLCNMALIPVSGEDADEMAGVRQLTVSESARKLMDIETAPVERRFVTAEVRMVGKVDYDETRLAYITARIPGRLDRLFVDYTGVPVQKGDHLASLYSPDLLVAQVELIEAIQAVKNVKDTELNRMREMAEAFLQHVRDKLRLWGLTAEQIDNIERTGEAADHITIYASASGIVIHKNAVEGMYVKEGTRIYTIADLSRVWVKLDAYESDLQWLRYGQEVEFTTVTYPGEVFTGTIAFIDPVLNAKIRTVKIRVNVPNAEGRLKPEMFVKAIVRVQIAGGSRVMDVNLLGKWMCPMHPDIIRDTSGICDICEMPLSTSEALGYASDDPATVEKPLVIPVTAALVTGTRAIVYVELPGRAKPTFEGREIVLGPRAGDYYLVRSGLSEGERVVVRGNFKIDSALQIMAKPSMMSPGTVRAAGHDHGLPPSTQGKTGPTAGDLAPYTMRQMQAIITAADDVSKAIAQKDLKLAQSAFLELGNAIDKVNMELLTVHTHMLWMELSMRLTNDAVEGSQAKDAKTAARVAAIMANNIESLKVELGIPSDYKPAPRLPVSKIFLEQMAQVFDRYFAIQQALADDNTEAVSVATGELFSTLGAVDIKLVSGEDHDRWMRRSTEIRTILEDSMARARDIKAQREYFYQVSQHIIKLAQHFGAPGTTPSYVLHCPMAFDNRGADWMQNDEQTRNPYFGKMMLRCGGVTDIVPAAVTKNKKDN